MTAHVMILPTMREAREARRIGVRIMVESGWPQARAARLWIGPATLGARRAHALNGPEWLVGGGAGPALGRAIRTELAAAPGHGQ